MERNPYSPPESQVVVAPAASERDGPEGLGGWLVIVGIGIVLRPLFLVFQIAQIYLPIFEDDVWSSLTTPGGAAYNPGWAPFVIGELIAIVGLLLASVALIVLFFRRSVRFPGWFIGMMIAYSAVQLVDVIGLKMIMPDQPIDKDMVSEIMRTLVQSVIWIPYMLMSRRVKNTFVNDAGF